MKSKNFFVSFSFWLVIFILYTPIFFIIFQAFLLNPYDFSSSFTLKWIKEFFSNRSLWEPLISSLEIAFISASISVLLGTLGALGLNGKLLGVSIHSLIMLPILLPEIITGLSLLLFFLLTKVHLGFWTVVISHASFSASFVYFIMIEQFKKFDTTYIEAAFDLGANSQEVFTKVTLPNIVPGIIASWLFAFTLSFDDFLISFFTSGGGVVTLPLKIYSMMRVGITPSLNALALVMICISTALVLLLMSGEQTRKWVRSG